MLTKRNNGAENEKNIQKCNQLIAYSMVWISFYSNTLKSNDINIFTVDFILLNTNSHKVALVAGWRFPLN